MNSRSVNGVARDIVVFLLALGSFWGASAAGDESSELPYRVETLATGLKFPWSLAFLLNGDALLTEKFGELRILRKGVLDPAPISGGPQNILKEGDSGLLDVVLDPDFETNQIIFITFHEGTKEQNHLAVFRAEFDGAKLTGGKVIFRSGPEKAGPGHSGGRMAFLQDGTFLVTVSDGFNYRDAAQDLGSDLGKVLRLDRDGQVPGDNPFVGKEGVRPEIFTYGHRNALGLLVDSRNGDIWLHENGPKGGDEINLLKPGRNYGWPKTTFGVDYSGELVSKLQRAPGVTDRCRYLGALDRAVGIYTLPGEKISAMDGRFFCGSARGEIDSSGKDSEWELDRATDIAQGIGYAYSRRADGTRRKHLRADRYGQRSSLAAQPALKSWRMDHFSFPRELFDRWVA